MQGHCRVIVQVDMAGMARAEGGAVIAAHSSAIKDTRATLSLIRSSPDRWHGRIVLPGSGGPLDVELRGNGPIDWPRALDGLAAAALPAAMRAGAGLLEINGEVTRGALRRLTEYSRAWASWSPRTLAPTRVEAQHVLDDERPAFNSPALVAWSGSLASTHTLVRLLHGLTPGAPRVGGVLRIAGIRPGDAESLADDQSLIEGAGLRFHFLRVASPVDTSTGRLPLIAAALHGVSSGYNHGVHARGWLFDAHRLYPRPGLALPDLLGGDGFPIHADGGMIPPPTQAREIAVHQPNLLSAMLRNVEWRSSGERTMTRLALHAAGVANTRPGLAATALLPLGDPAIAAEAAATLADWRGGSGERAIKRLLAARLRVRRATVMGRDYGRWGLASLRFRPVWPR